MPEYKATFFFKDNNAYGWTETYHSLLGSLQGVMDQAFNQLTLRTPLLGDGAQCVYIRVSDDLVKRDSLVRVVTARQGKGGSLGLGFADIANTCLVVRLQHNELFRRTLYMRGIYDAIVDDNGRYQPTAAFTEAFQLWAASLKNNNWAMRNKKRDTPSFNIVAIAQNPINGEITITTAAPHGLLQNQTVLIRGVKGPTFLNGASSVFAVPSPTTFVLKSNRMLSAWLGGGIVSASTFELHVINTAQVVRASHRIAGRPFDSPRGRRLVRSRR